MLPRNTSTVSACQLFPLQSLLSANHFTSPHKRIYRIPSVQFSDEGNTKPFKFTREHSVRKCQSLSCHAPAPSREGDAEAFVFSFQQKCQGLRRSEVLSQ